jgi:flagellar protein FliL
MADRPVDHDILDESEIEAPPKSMRKKKLLFLLLGFLLLCGASVGAVAYFIPEIIPEPVKNLPQSTMALAESLKDSLPFIGKKDPEKPEKDGDKKKEGEGGHLYNLDPFLVNLADTGKMRYLKVRMILESSENKPNEEYEKRLPQLRDIVLSVLSTKTQNDISDSEGKKKLREELTEKLNTQLTQFKVKTLYFTEFVIQ